MHREAAVAKIAVERERAVEREGPDDSEADGVGQAEVFIGKPTQLAKPGLYESGIDEHHLVSAAVKEGRADVSGAGAVEP